MVAALEFPPELHDLIVEHMHGHKEALGTCGLVSKSWLRSSRYHLFGCVGLRNHNWKSFLELVASPLTTFTQSINVLDILQPNEESFDELIPRLPEFPRLKRLRLDNVYWAGVSNTTANSFVAKFRNVPQFDLHLVTFNSSQQMATLISRFSRLQKTSICPIFLGDGIAPLLSDDFAVPRNLEHARLRLPAAPSGGLRFNQIVAWLHAGDTPPPIRILELGILGPTTLPSAGNLLRALGPDLHDLDLKLDRLTAGDIQTHVDLSRSTGIQRLTIHFSLRVYGAESQHAAASWALLTAAHSAIVTALTVVIYIDYFNLLDNLDWAHLNTLLETSPQFAALQRLHFIMQCFSSMDLNVVEEAIRSRVPEYDSRGIVEISLLRRARVFTHGP